MAFEVGTADNHEDLLTRILRFITGSPTLSAPVKTGTGNGTLRTLEGLPGAPTETWTLTCTAAAANSGTFSVVGSVSGAQASATVGLAYDNGKVKFRIADGSVDFIVGDQFTFNATAGVMPALQRWQIMRKTRDNLKAVTSNMSSSGGWFSGSRSDHRRLNTFNWGNSVASTNSGFVAGTSHMTYELHEPAEVKKVRITAPYSNSGYIPGIIRNFRLQWSDDGSAWTTAQTYTGTAAWQLGEVRDYSVTANHGYHPFWRILIDSIASGSTVYIVTLQLLDVNGDSVNNYGSEVILRAPGNDGSDNIYTGIRSEYDVTYDTYNFVLMGYTGFDPNTVSFWEHPGALPGYTNPQYNLAAPHVPLWNSSTPYWISASGRSLRMGAKVSTSYEGMYLGYLMPYASPSQYPYPLAVAGSLCGDYSGTNLRWSAAGGWHSTLPCPGSSSSSPHYSETSSASTMYIRDPGGLWKAMSTRASSDSRLLASRSTNPPYTISPGTGRYVFPMGTMASSNSSQYATAFRENVDGNYVLIPLTLVNTTNPVCVWGELEGVYWTSGYNNASENTMTYNGNTVVVLQNAGRTTLVDYWALELK